jgi:hypothetical protein
MRSSNDNFVKTHEDDKHYSLKALSTIQAIVSISDLIKIINDPGICQQTLAIYNEVCIKIKNIKENRSDAVVKYFQEQLVG